MGDGEAFEFLSLFKKSVCTLIHGKSRKWESSNSTVFSCPALDLNGVFARESRLEAGASLVSIDGEADEDLHFHTSHLLGTVVRGEGFLCVPTDLANAQAGRISRIPVQPGDVVVIPRGALHIFQCEVGKRLEYIALEVSDSPIDYQKHH
jgi:quercetin dioxygenase-like cupin family protein